MNLQVCIKEVPTAELAVGHFEVHEGSVPDAVQPGQLLLRTRFLSIDPAHRARFHQTRAYERVASSYGERMGPGVVMTGRVLAEVTESASPDVAVGDLVVAHTGWQEWAVADAGEVRVVTRLEGLPESHYLSVLGVSGMTAYFGLFAVGRPTAGCTVLVSSAAGAVGSTVAQLARIAGCRVVGLTGSPEKAAWLTDELGLNGAVNYRVDDVAAAIREACPEGVDMYFDNVGGDLLGAALKVMNERGTIVACGASASYDGEYKPAVGPRGVPGTLVTKRLRMEGFVVHDHLGGAAEQLAVDRVSGWIKTGRMIAAEDIHDGLASAPGALVDLLHGGNKGKRLVRL